MGAGRTRAPMLTRPPLADKAASVPEMTCGPAPKQTVHCAHVIFTICPVCTCELEPLCSSLQLNEFDQCHISEISNAAWRSVGSSWGSRQHSTGHFPLYCFLSLLNPTLLQPRSLALEAWKDLNLTFRGSGSTLPRL